MNATFFFLQNCSLQRDEQLMSMRFYFGVMIRNIRLNSVPLVRYYSSGTKIKSPGEVDITLSNG